MQQINVSLFSVIMGDLDRFTWFYFLDFSCFWIIFCWVIFHQLLSFILPHVIKININRKLKENKEDTQFTE